MFKNAYKYHIGLNSKKSKINLDGSLLSFKLLTCNVIKKNKKERAVIRESYRIFNKLLKKMSKKVIFN